MIDPQSVDVNWDGIAIHMSNLIMRHDPTNGTESFMDPREAAVEYLKIVRALGLDGDHLINRGCENRRRSGLWVAEAITRAQTIRITCHFMRIFRRGLSIPNHKFIE